MSKARWLPVFSQEEAEDMMGPRPPAPEFFVDTAWKAGGTKPKDSAPNYSSAERNHRPGLEPTYDGPINRKGLPKRRPFQPTRWVGGAIRAGRAIQALTPRSGR